MQLIFAYFVSKSYSYDYFGYFCNMFNNKKKVMKKLVVLTMAAAMFMLAGCSKNTPKGVVNTYYSEMQKKNYDKSAECFMKIDGETQSAKAFAGKLKESVEESEGLKSYEILSDSICNDTLAFVRTKYVFGNGEEGESNVEVVLQDGEWKINPMSK